MEKEKIKHLLEELDTEIGSTITYSDDKGVVLDNMTRANLILLMLKKELDIEF